MEKVSVVIMTYNSEKTICDTLDSVMRQTYENIELIIQDDCSQDETLKVVEIWARNNLKLNDTIDFHIYRNSTNLGIPQNFNEGCKKTSGVWIKTLGGDDVLIDDCIERNVRFAKRIKEDVLLVSDVYEFYDGKDGKRKYKQGLNEYDKRYLEKFNKYDSQKQYRHLLKRFSFYAPTFFFSKKGLDEIGGYDIRYRVMEDWPLVLKWTKCGKCIRYMDVKTVNYRLSSLDSLKSKEFYISNRYKGVDMFKREEVYPNISKFDFLYWINEGISWFIRGVMINVFKNKKTVCSTLVYYILTWLAPYNWPRKINSLKNLKIAGLLRNQKWSLKKI